MTSVVFLLTLVWGLTSVKASEGVSYEAGKAFASRNQARIPQDASQIPGYQGTNVPEAGLSHRTLQDALVQKLREPDNAAALISQSHDQRLRFDIDPDKDLLFTESDKIVADPLTILKAEETEIEEPNKETRTRHTCTQGGEPYAISCTRNLHVQTVQKTKIYKQSHIHGYMFKRYHVGGNPQYSNPHISGYRHDGRYNVTVHDPSLAEVNWRFHDGANWYAHHVRNEYSYTKEFPGEAPTTISEQEYINTNLSEGDIREAWTSDCDRLEEKVDQGHCAYVEKRCTQGPETRLINGFSVTKDCWQETLTYQCSPPQKNTCEDLKARGCIQVGSECTQREGERCVEYTQTYECIERSGGRKKVCLSGGVPWCLDGNCAEQGYAPNKDMAEALSRLMIFREVQKDMKDYKIFSPVKRNEHSEDWKCRRFCLSFIDCCGSGKGWGKDLNLSECSQENEKPLFEMRQQKKCVYVGTYCAEKAPLVGCIVKKSSYCCFQSKFARLIQEQGKRQLGLSFGTAEHPQCRGLTVEELSRLDFSKIDLSELLQEAMSKVNPPNVPKLSQDFNQDWKHRIPKIQKDDKRYTERLKEEAAQKGEGHEVVF